MSRNTYKWAADGLIDGSAPLNSIPRADIQDGDLCVTIKQGDCAYHYVYDGLSEASQDVPNVIAPQDAGANPGRWILHCVYDAMKVDGSNLAIASLTDGDMFEWDGGKLGKSPPKMNIDGSNLAIGSDADGDMYYRASSALARLAKGTARYNMAMNSGATAPEWVASLQSILTTAGDLIYASAANTPARHPKGTANHKLFMHASNDAPEWDTGMKIVSSNRDMTAATGDVSYSGFGFKPSAILVLTTINNEDNMSIGIADASLGRVIVRRASTATFVFRNNIAAYEPDATNYQRAEVKSWDSDGVTFTWTKTASPTGTLVIHMLAWR